MAAFVAGSVVGGALVGGLLGLLGQALAGLSGGVSPGGALVVLAVAAVVGLLADFHVGGARVPTVHRQVDERWLDTYRGWVYGFGFGFQLGTGVLTIVSGSIQYVVWLAAFLTGSWAAGLLLGVVFGLARALPQLAARGAVHPEGVRDLVQGALRWKSPVTRAARIAQGAAAGIAVVLASGVV
ncbi:MAG: hypothetical protein MUF83_11070 [Acidimicrobiales bacterium]|nr:hypothetical protein [Acidimicrobiales bacterium]